VRFKLFNQEKKTLLGGRTQSTIFWTSWFSLSNLEAKLISMNSDSVYI